jgi:alpha-ketoglutarate-dependent taurine dioxygenase
VSGSAAVKRVWAETGVLHVEWADGRSEGFASLWLRDNRPQDRDAHSGQRLTDVADLPLNPMIRSARLRDGLIVVEWQGEAARAEFPPAWLRAHAAEYRADVSGARRRRWLPGADLDALRDFQWADGAALAADAGARSVWLAGLLADGIAFLRDVPRVDGGILDAMAPIGQVLETNYGLVFDVRSVPRPENLAYSDLGLGLHTDNPYREPVPGFQALHALITSPDGGESLFADGLAIAEHLRDVAPEEFLRLTRTPVPFAYRSRSAQLQADRPFIQLSCTGEVDAVHYNSRSIAPLRLAPGDVEAFYAAYRRFAGLLREPRFQVRFKLRDGDCVVFDNQRTLHGRLAFSSARHARHLRGCYLTRDSVYSEAARSGRG